MKKEKIIQIIAALVINFIIAWPLSYALSITDINHQVTDNSALITWQTDEHSTSSVHFGKNKNTELSKYNQTLIKDHSVKLSYLEFSTLYYYKVRSCDSENKCNISGLSNFTTENIPPPEKITGLQNTSATATTINLKWDRSTSKYLKHYIIYRNNEVAGNITTTTFTDTGLTASTNYNYEVSAVDTGGNIGEKSDTLTITTKEPDLTAPQIDNVTLAALSANSATITWVTNEDSNSTIYYGETSSLDKLQGLSTYTKTHSIQISNLVNGTVYYYKVESCDISGNCAASQLDEFVPGADTTIPTIDVVLPQYHNKNIIKVRGKTKPYSDVKFYVNGIYKGILSKASTANGNIDIELKGLQEGNNTIKIIAIDSHNLKGEKEYSVVVDTRLPVYTISSIPKLSKQSNLIINGTVNEPCTITFYSQLVSEGINVPKNVENFHSQYEKLTPNSVTLVWDELENVDHYAIYRNDVGLIGIPVKPPFVDMYANTSTTYTYEIAAVYKDCSSGTKVSISVKTLDGGNVNIRKPTQLQAKCSGITPKGSITTKDYFTYSLGLNSGMNEVTINISDVAGNSVLIRNKTIYDSSPPQITYSNLDKLSPSYTQEVTIEGEVSEHAKIFVYIDDDKEASYKAETDAEGKFSVKVELRRKVTGDYEVKQTSVNVIAESAPLWENKIKIIAIDDVGLESNAVTGTIAYQVCGQGGDWNIEIGEVTPDILIPRFLLQGVSRIGFNVNFKWQGPGENKDATITERPMITLRPLNKADQEKFDEEFFGNVWEKHSNYYRSSYFLIDLKKQYAEQKNLTTLEQENNLSKHNLGKCIVPGFGCVKLPLMLEIHYSYKQPYGTTMTGTKGEEYEPLARRDVREEIVYGTQRQCFNVEIAIDRRLPIDKLLPKSFLKAMVEGINETIKGIDLVLKPVDIAKKFVFVGCMGTWVVWFVFKFKEWTACKAGGIIEGFNPNTCNPEEKSDKGEACASCLKARAETIKHWERTTWICDRVICPAAPTIQKYVRDANKNSPEKQKKLGILDSLIQRSHCEAQYSSIDKIEFTRSRKDTVDQEYRNTENYVIEARNVESGVKGYPDETYCESEYIKNYDSVAIFMKELKESQCVSKAKDEKIEGCGGIGTVPRLLRGVCEASEDEGPRLISSEGATYLIADDEFYTKPRNAAYKITQKTDIQLGEEKNGYFAIDQGGLLLETIGQKLGFKDEYQGQKVYVRKESKVMDESHCYVVDGGYNQNSQELPNREYIEYDDLLDNKRRKELGIDDDNGRAKNDIWYIGNFKTQMCGKGKKTIKLNEFADGDVAEIGNMVYNRINNLWFLSDGDKKNSLTDQELINQLKSNSGTLTRGGINYDYNQQENSFVNLGECKQIPRAVWEEVCGDEAKDYVIDPTADLISAFQSGCLTAISAYLTQYKTMLQMIKHCFEQLLYTGEGSSGVCKQFLSVYLCDLIYYGIRCIVEKAGRGYGQQRIQGGVLGFINYLRDGGANIQNSIRGRYGTSTIYRTMFVERKLIHSACALAFTGDFDLDLDATLEANIATPIKTMCYLNGNRRYAYADPSTGRATFLYNLGVFIVSGGSAGSITTGRGASITTTETDITRPLIKPITYRVQLVCSNTNNCKSDISETGSCDCLTYGGEQEKRSSQGEITWTIPVGDGTLEQGETLNEELYYDKAVNLPYRFDRARILISYVDNTGVEHIDEICGETYIEGVGAQPPSMCKFDITQGFICEFEWGEFVTAYFQDVKIKSDRPKEEKTETNELRVGDVIELEGKIIKEGSSQKMEEQKVYLRYRVYSAYDDELVDNYVEITKRNTDLETDFNLGGYSCPGIKINDKLTVKYDEKTNQINPFLISSSRNLALNVEKESGSSMSVTSDTDINQIGMISQIKITFTKENERFYFSIDEGNCEGFENNKKKEYNIQITCSTENKVSLGNKIKLFITGTPKKNGERLIINSIGIRTPESGDRRHIYLDISLHTTNEYGDKDLTPLTYDKETQKKTFDFYVYKTAAEEKPSEKAEEVKKVADCGDKIVEISKKALDVPYCLGAVEWTAGEVKKDNCGVIEGYSCKTTGNDVGCSLDCSSFTKWVYDTYAKENNDNNFKIEDRYADWQANNVGRIVDANPGNQPCGPKFKPKTINFNSLQKGDLIFFCNTDSDSPNKADISHVGIYIGDKQMIHASSVAGKVTSANLEDEYYKSRYAGARRVCPDEK